MVSYFASPRNNVVHLHIVLTDAFLLNERYFLNVQCSPVDFVVKWSSFPMVMTLECENTYFPVNDYSVELVVELVVAVKKSVAHVAYAVDHHEMIVVAVVESSVIEKNVEEHYAWI